MQQLSFLFPLLKTKVPLQPQLPAPPRTIVTAPCSPARVCAFILKSSQAPSSDRDSVRLDLKPWVRHCSRDPSQPPPLMSHCISAKKNYIKKLKIIHGHGDFFSRKAMLDVQLGMAQIFGPYQYDKASKANVKWQPIVENERVLTVHLRGGDVWLQSKKRASLVWCDHIQVWWRWWRLRRESACARPIPESKFIDGFALCLVSRFSFHACDAFQHSRRADSFAAPFLSGRQHMPTANARSSAW